MARKRFISLGIAALVVALAIRVHSGALEVRPTGFLKNGEVAARPVPEDWQDEFNDGTPDFLRLDSPNDQLAFRRWFTAIAEYQALRPSSDIPSEINDCAALIRYSYRNALSRHDEIGVRDTRILPPAALPPLEKYKYPFTPLGGALFRVRPGSFAPSDLKNGAFAEFADAKTLKNFNMHYLSRDVHAARPGDVLFFRQPEQDSEFHSMIFIGSSEWDFENGPDPATDLVVYHTGPVGNGPGEMRRLRLADLIRFPSPRWRPIPGNPNFLGVYRWNILRGTSQ